MKMEDICDDFKSKNKPPKGALLPAEHGAIIRDPSMSQCLCCVGMTCIVVYADSRWFRYRVAKGLMLCILSCNSSHNRAPSWAFRVSNLTISFDH